MATLSFPALPSAFDAFRSPDFRLYFAGQLISISGTWMQNLAQGYLVFQLTRSEAMLGLVACAAGLPIILMSPIAGVLVDRFPRRQILLFTQTCQMIFALILAFLALTGWLQVWHIVMLAFLLGTTNALDVPARWTFVSEIVGKELLRSGIAMNSILNSSARVLGPALAGIILVKFGAPLCFFLNAISFLFVIPCILVMKVHHSIPTARGNNPLKQLSAGFAFVRGDPLIRTLLLLAMVSGAFILPLIQLTPAFADTVLHSPEEGYAAMAAAQGIGSVLAALTVGLISNRVSYARLISTGLIMASVGTFLLAFQTQIITASAASFVVGFFMIMQFISINTWLQLSIPESYRGRVMALYTLSFTGVAPFGALVLGLIANITSTPFALILYAFAGIIIGMGIWVHYQRSEKLTVQTVES